MLWKHTDFRPNGRVHSVRSRRLIIQMVATVAKYALLPSLDALRVVPLPMLTTLAPVAMSISSHGPLNKMALWSWRLS
jgi:hypothetical protein